MIKVLGISIEKNGLGSIELDSSCLKHDLYVLGQSMEYGVPALVFRCRFCSRRYTMIRSIFYKHLITDGKVWT
jgi:hypothetical protein